MPTVHVSARIEALIALAQRRGTTLRGIMAELGLHSEANAPNPSSLPSLQIALSP